MVKCIFPSIASLQENKTDQKATEIHPSEVGFKRVWMCVNGEIEKIQNGNGDRALQMLHFQHGYRARSSQNKAKLTCLTCSWTN